MSMCCAMAHTHLPSIHTSYKETALSASGLLPKKLCEAQLDPLEALKSKAGLGSVVGRALLSTGKARVQSSAAQYDRHEN